MRDLDEAVFGLINDVDDVLFYDAADLARPDEDELFERWLADVSISDFERLLDDLITDTSGTLGLLSAS